MTKRDDGFFYLITNVTAFTRTQKFAPGIEIAQKSVDGRRMRNVFTIKGSKLIEQQFGDKNVTIIREFFENELISTSRCGDVVTKSLCRAMDE